MITSILVFFFSDTLTSLIQMMSFMKDFDHLRIQMNDIVSATNNFDPTRVIGAGGFGSVYKGELSSPEGQITVACKKLDRRHGQGNIEFWKEIMMLSTYKHENLISLMHYCIESDDMILVYEYASRGSLDRYLSDSSTLTWIRRLKICVGAARGLCFLHDPKDTQQRVLHRDVKSSNILLDKNWTAKVADFGLSKVGPANQAHTYLVSHGVGTPGYCDPLYMELGFLSKESDVYSFGVVLFEVLCGRLCYEYCNRELTNILVPKWRRCYNENRLDEIILPSLKEQMHPDSLKSFSAIAHQCVKKDREERPTMAVIIEKLEFSLEQQEIFQNTPESSHRESSGLKLTRLIDQSPDNDHRDNFESSSQKKKTRHVYDSHKVKNSFRDQAYDAYSQASSFDDNVCDDSYDTEDVTTLTCNILEGGRVIGDAKPGGVLFARVFPEKSHMYQWVRFKDGIVMDIDGATDQKYVVTADDIDTLVAVECKSWDDDGRKGELVRLFANKCNKISCDREMQQEIDDYLSVRRASFGSLRMEGLSWKQATLSLTRYKFKITMDHGQSILMNMKCYKNLSIEIPSGFTTQCTLRFDDCSSDRYNFIDYRTRDTFVLTMRIFQRKFLLNGEE